MAIKDLNKKQREKNISVDLEHLDAKQGIPFSNNFFDAMYAHMFFNMRFTDNELKFLFSESSRVLKTTACCISLFEMTKIIYIIKVRK